MSALTEQRPIVTKKLTCQEFWDLGESGFFDGHRVILVDGEVIFMSPINFPHVISTHMVRKLLESIFPDTQFWVKPQDPLALSLSTDPQPDVAVVPGAFSSFTAHPTTALLIVEVSDTTLSFDLGDKADLYATGNIEDYWVLDLNRRRLFVHRDPQNGVYTTITTHAETELVSPLAMPNATILVSDMLP